MFKQIALAVDGSTSAEAACNKAIEIAREHGANITATYVVDPYPYSALGEDRADAFYAYMHQAEQEAAEATRRLIEKAKAAGVHVQSRVIEGDDVAHAIVRAAHQADADVVLLGTGSRSLLRRLVKRSVAKKVQSISSIPVMVVS